MAEIKKDILWRVRIVYGLMCVFAIIIFVQVCRIKFVNGEVLKEKARNNMFHMQSIEPLRGHIFSSDGKLLATSIPNYDLYIDTKAEAFKAKNNFHAKIDSLSIGLANILGDRTAKEYKSIIKDSRTRGERYHPLSKNVSYKQLNEIKKLPVFNHGKYSGGLVVEARWVRERIYEELAKRTIGFDRSTASKVGIEAAFDSALTGVSGERLVQRVAGGVWKPVSDENEIEAQDGMDVVATIDLDLQDVASSALLAQLQNNNATKGCAIVMEVATGHVKAISNLERGKDGQYHEFYNYAIGQSTEPGSTIKLASLMAAMEDGYITTETSIDIENGDTWFGKAHVQDHDKGKYNRLTVQQIFEKSSNVGVAKVVYQYYSKSPDKFSQRLKRFGLGEKLGLQLQGEADPILKDTRSKTWSASTLPVMSYGYETQFTPLQLLAFYNAVANNGKMVRPMFVKELRKQGKLIKKFETTTVREKICSDKTLQQARKMMEGVVQHGTATNLKFDTYTIAGKTGTAKMAFGKSGYSQSDSVRYQASFCGYFPADKPLYSCIVVLYDLSSKFYYGNVAAGPVFKEIADKIYAGSIAMHHELATDSLITQKQPSIKSGDATSTQTVLSMLHKKPLNLTNGIYSSNKNGQATKVNVYNGLVPDVSGMNLRDAIYVLEGSGLQVVPKGKGIVRKQSIVAGTKIQKGRQIIIELS